MSTFFFNKRILVVFVGILVFTSCNIIRHFDWNIANQNDYRTFPSNVLLKNQNPFVFYPNDNKNALRLPGILLLDNKEYEFEKALEESGTLAYLIVKNDTIIYEKYFDNYNEDSTISSFSVVKSFVSALVGIAINEGYIKSIKDPVTDYVPQLKNSSFGRITIENLLDMQSGISFNERSVSPFGDIAKYYYGKNIKKYIGTLQTKEEPGKVFEYSSVDAQLLGMVLENATRKKAKVKDKEAMQLVAKPGNDFYASGLLGQFIYVSPEKNIIIVRLGKKNGKIKWTDVFHKIAENI